MNGLRVAAVLGPQLLLTTFSLALLRVPHYVVVTYAGEQQDLGSR